MVSLGKYKLELSLSQLSFQRLFRSIKDKKVGLNLEIA